MSPAHPDLPPHPRMSGQARTRSRERRAVRIGFGVSVVVHLLVLVLYPLIMDRLTPRPFPAEPTPFDREDRGTVVLLIREIPPEDEPDPVVEAPEEPTVPVPVPPAPPVAPDPALPAPDVEEEEERRRATAAERLQPAMGDPRVWAPLDQRHTELTDEERAELLLRGMIRSWNDSVAVAAALSGQALDWTYTDDDGRRWGLSPGRLHLGDFSIPLPFSFEMPPGRREAMARRQWEMEDILRGAVSSEVREVWAERAREIRERMERERRGGR
jgi:hypothetical protein